MKRQELIRQGLGRWVINLSLNRFEGIEKIIERREEDDPMARRVLMVNEACALPGTDTAEACHKERLTHLSHLHYRARSRSKRLSSGRPANVLGRREALSGAPHDRALVGATDLIGARSTPGTPWLELSFALRNIDR